MTDKDYDAVDAFMIDVRQAYHRMLDAADSKDEATMLAQDRLSLYSPWMKHDDREIA